MIENVYQLVNELPCEDIYLLQDRGELQSKKVRQLITKKCYRKFHWE